MTPVMKQQSVRITKKSSNIKIPSFQTQQLFLQSVKMYTKLNEYFVTKLTAITMACPYPALVDALSLVARKPSPDLTTGELNLGISRMVMTSEAVTAVLPYFITVL